jgi:mannose-6-phosphate isomerase-like protein (cupin superfamily)
MKRVTYMPYNYSQNPANWNTTDYGPAPLVFNIDEETKNNPTFRTTRWTGTYMQLTYMSIPPGQEIGLENHTHVDQFIRLEDGEGIILMGNSPCNLSIRQPVYDDIAVMIPAGTWHNLINTGNTPIKLYSIYSPIQHPPGTVHQTKADAENSEHH